MDEHRLAPSVPRIRVNPDRSWFRYREVMAEIVNREALEAVFGRWPSFHDAEVLALRLDRGDSEAVEHDRRQPWLEADIHVFEMTDQVTEEGTYLLRHHTLVTFAFRGVDHLDLKWFNNQNVLWDLELIEPQVEGEDAGRWVIGMPSSNGAEASFRCESVELVDVKAFTPPSRLR